jgi:hypothetical protein
MRISRHVPLAALAAVSLASLTLGASQAQSQPVSPPTALPVTPAPSTSPTGRAVTPAELTVTSNLPIGKIGPGLDSAHSVNPAPGATGPYLGQGENGFYDVQARISRVEKKAETALSGAKRRQALAEIRSIRAEVATQESRHGGQLRDWDRENLNHRLNRLEVQVGLVQAPHDQ